MNHIGRRYTLVMRNEVGTILRWLMFRDRRRPVSWMLLDHTGHLRTLEPTYELSAPLVQLIAENHGLEWMKTEIELPRRNFN